MTTVDEFRTKTARGNDAGVTGRFAAPAAAGLPWPVTLYLLCVVIPIVIDVGPLKMTNLRLLLLVLTVPLMVRVLGGHYGKVLLTDVLFTLHILWAAVALWVNNPDRVVEQIGSVGMEFLGGYAVGRAYVRTPEAFTALCKRLVLIVCLSFPFALVETLTGRPVVLEAIRSLPGVQTLEFNHQDPRMGLERVQFTFAHPIHYGLFCSVAMSLAFVGLKGVTSDVWRYLSSAIVGLSGFLALSSGALLAIFLQLGLFAWAAAFASVRSRWWLLTALFALAYVAIEVLSNRSAIMVFLSYATFSAHTAYWRTIIFEWGMKNVWANPLFGIGLNDWVRPWFMYSGSMDNFWLVMAVRYGIPGFLPIAVGYVVALGRIIGRNFEGDARLTQIRLAWAFSFMGITFTLCTVHVWTNVYSFLFFMFGAGMWLLTAEPAVERSAPAAETPSPTGMTYTRTGTGHYVGQTPAARMAEGETAFTRFPDNGGTRVQDNRFSRAYRLGDKEGSTR